MKKILEKTIAHIKAIAAKITGLFHASPKSPRKAKNVSVRNVGRTAQNTGYEAKASGVTKQTQQRVSSTKNTSSASHNIRNIAENLLHHKKKTGGKPAFHLPKSISGKSFKSIASNLTGVAEVKSPSDSPRASLNKKNKRLKIVDKRRFGTFAIAAVFLISVILGSILLATGNKKTTAKVASANATPAVTSSAPENTPENTDEPTPSAPPKANGTPELTPGTHSEAVKKLQQRLMDLDYMEDDDPTDYYGPQTQYSLELFQRKMNLQVDGIAGSETLAILNSKQAKHYTVSLGAYGTDVESIQQRLIELKFLKGKATGKFGKDTENAVKTFQEQNGLDADGNVGADTREAIYNEDTKSYQAPAKPTPSASKNTNTKKPTKKPVKKKTEKKTYKSTKRIPNAKNVSSLIAVAKSLLGHDYVRGGKGPNVFDCSGFVYYCLKTIGVKLGYMTSGGWAGCSYARVVKMSELKAGDIICYKGHVAIYLGGGRQIDASSSQDKIRITGDIFSSHYWRSSFICGRRVL